MTEAKSCFNFSILTKTQQRRAGEREEEVRRGEDREEMEEQTMKSSWVEVVGAKLLSDGQVHVRAELSDGTFLQLNKTDEDLAQMMKRLVDGFPDD